MLITIFLFALSAQTVSYYVSISGLDDSECGEKDSPCASINQVLFNHPNESCDVLITAGDYPTNPIFLNGLAQVVFKGAGVEVTNIFTDNWNSDTFITNTASSGFEFHDLSLNISMLGMAAFTRIKNNAIGFFDVVVNCSEYVNVMEITGGSVSVNNVSFSNTLFAYVVLKKDADDGADTSVNITNSIFSNIRNGFGGLVSLAGPGFTNVIVNNNSFQNVLATVNFFTFNLSDDGGSVSVTNNVFNNTEALGPCVRVGLLQGKSATVVQNVTFNNATALFYYSGGLAVIGSGADQPVTLNTLKFTNCTGPITGALYAESLTLNLSHASFAANTGNSANDIIHAYPSTAPLKYYIVDSYSSSEPVKAAILFLDTNALQDISDVLPDPSSSLANNGYPFLQFDESNSPGKAN